MAARPVVLSIAGYDPSSGAGVTADIKTAAALGCYAVTCLTALTVQSTQGVFAVEPLAPKLVAHTLKVLADDFPIDAVRLGMLGSGQTAEVVVDFLESRRPRHVVLDPVIRSSSGMPLIDPAGLKVIRQRLVGVCDVITPNVGEAALLTDSETIPNNAPWDVVSPQLLVLADNLHLLGAPAVVITGGHLDPPNDLLSYLQNGLRQEQVFPGARIKSRATHGKGCAFATAVACELALGRGLPEAVKAAKAFVRSAIEAAYPLGKGVGPMNHLFRR